MGAKRRILQGIGANGFGQAVTLLIQVASIPILINAWGLELYGEWITLSAIPAYLVLSDIGLTSIAGNSLALIAEEDNIKEMRVIFQSTWLMVSALSLLIFFPVAALVIIADLGSVFGLIQINGDALTVTLILLFLHVVLSMQTGILQLPFRALKKNPIAVSAVNTIRLLEWVAATVLVLTGGGVIQVAIAFVMVRMLGNIALWFMVRKTKSPLQYGVQFASVSSIRKLLRPSIASMCFPLGLSFTMQGFILLVGAMVGSVGVATFSIYRTFTRVPIQLATAINQAVWPELSYAFGARDYGKSKRLVKKMQQFGAIISVLSVVVIYFFGVGIINIWVSEKLDHSFPLLISLALTAMFHILWQPYWVAQMAINKHINFAINFLVLSMFSILLGWALINVYKLEGAGYALLASEVLLGVAAILTFLKYFESDSSV